jgi:tRNA nucleotidyltransferase/poly(A) polymerase
MPDYIYLLENRLSSDQQNALRQLREAAREAGMILFLTGDAVRDLTSGHAVRELEVAVHGNALKLKKTVENLGGAVWGEDVATRALYLCFPGTVRVDVVSTYRVEYPKPGQPVYHPASIQEDLRRRDFTANAMAISLNEGSFGLLMDPMNGAADIEARLLRLVSNYGFLDDPSLLIRATRYRARLGWELETRTQTRHDNAKEEGVIEFLSDAARSQELEQIGHEAEGLKVLQALDAEGWMKVLFPAWTPAKADEEKLKALHDLAADLMVQGIHPDMSAAQMQLLTAKMAAKDLAALKKLMLRPGFVEEWNSLDEMAARFAKLLLAKENAIPSAGYKLLTSHDPEAVLWLGFTSKDQAVRERFNLFLKVWPEVRQRVPYGLMQEMRITPDLPGYAGIVQSIFLELLDGKLSTTEEMRAFLEPHSPPAPPPQVTIKRPRAKRGADAKVKEDSYDEDGDSDDGLDDDEDLDDIGGDDDDMDIGIPMPKISLEVDLNDEADAEADAEEDEREAEEAAPAPAKRGSAAAKAAKEPAAPAREKHAKEAPAPEKPHKAPTNHAAPTAKHAGSPPAAAHVAPKAEPAAALKKKAPAAPPVKASKAVKPPVGKAPVKAHAHPPAKAVKAALHRPVKPLAKPVAKAPVKAAAKAPVKSAPAKGKPAAQGKVESRAAKPVKHAAKKPAAKKR